MGDEETVCKNGQPVIDGECWSWSVVYKFIFETFMIKKNAQTL